MQFIDADAVVADSTQMTDLPEQPTDAKGRPIDPTDVLPDEPMKQAPNISTFSGPQTNCMIHLYRGELGKMVAYRIRLDTSTNWAVSTTSVLTVLAMGDDSVPHYFFAFILFINTAFLLIEARRYQIFLASRARVRILESGFFSATVLHGIEATPVEDAKVVPLTNDNIVPEHAASPLDDWQPQLKRALMSLTSKHVSWTTIYVRWQRNYIYLFTATYLGWIFKMLAYDAFHWAVFGSVTGFLLLAAGLAHYFRPNIKTRESEFMHKKDKGKWSAFPADDD